ncbi:MAG: hypothetical protein KJ044_16165, partial [Planctomycetes bacterium]|nr:hypothetical protein [Planctomycetota bacterium]
MYQIKLGDKSPVPYIFTNSNIVTPHSVINNGTLVVEGEKITFVGSILPPELKSRTESVYIDVGGKYILPGLIDSHSDAIELELVPTDSNSSTIQQALINLDYKFASLGITTTLHALPLTDAPFKQRSISHSEQIIETIIPFKEISLIDHMIFARCDILLDADSLSRVITILKKYRINIASLQDHSPGQGQFQDKVKLEKYLIHNYGMNPTDAEDYVKRMLFLRETRSQYNATQIANEIREAQGVLISHDDDTIEKIKWM